MNEVIQQETKDLAATAHLPAMIERVADSILKKAKSITIATDEDYLTAGRFASEAGIELDRLEAERVKFKEPFLSGGKQVDDHYRLALKTLKDAVAQVKVYMSGYNDKKKLAAAAEQKRKDDERAAAAAEARKREEEALAKIREEEQARVRAAEAQAAEDRKKRQAAEAEARKADEERQAADARAAGDRASAALFEQRAKDAQKEAEQAKADAATERQKAIDAKRAELKAQRETAAAVQTMETATAAASTAAATALKPVETRVAGAGERITVKWKWRLKNPTADVKALIAENLIRPNYLILDQEAIQEVCDKVKDKKLAEQILGPSFEVYPEESIALKKGSKT